MTSGPDKHGRSKDGAQEGELSTSDPLTPLEKGFSCWAAAWKCEQVSAQLVRLAGLLRCMRPDRETPKSVLSDRAMVECMISGRQLRRELFDVGLFADPVWDILLELYRANIDRQRITIAKLCDATALPASTAVRYIRALVEERIVVTEAIPAGQQDTVPKLTETGVVTMRAFCERFSELLGAAVGM